GSRCWRRSPAPTATRAPTHPAIRARRETRRRTMVDLPRVPIGDWVESGVDWLTDNATWIFRLIRDVLGWLIDHLEDLLLWPDALILIALFGLLAWWVRGLPFAVFTVLAFGLVESMGHWAPT